MNITVDWVSVDDRLPQESDADIKGEVLATDGVTVHLTPWIIVVGTFGASRIKHWAKVPKLPQ